MNFPNPGVHAYLEQLGNAIARMGANGSQSKTWCVSLASVFLLGKGRTSAASTALFPVSLFWAVDAYQLHLERDFRRRYSSFV